ncbi:MAG TPA: phytanoyl-CoA dioxygenase family protein [Chthonomonadaceae bacterium]|nr:phytanoyl-CoA dioxygenase family protein [Chthonomonadaceae bacterium]
MKLKMAHQELELGGKYLGTLREANDLLDDPAALQARMAEDGYLLLRGLHNKEKVLAARRLILENLDANGQIDRSYPLMEGVVKEGARGAFLGGSKPLTRNQTFLDLVESPEVMGFFAHFLQGDVLTYDYKWLRVVGPGDFTGAHYDIVYMGRGTHNVYTTWTPLGDVPYEMGPLALLVGSHRGPGFERVRETYGKMDVDRDKVQGWFSNDPLEMVDKFGGQWQTTEFQAGDALIFGMFTMHGSLTNVSNRYRITTDTRYQRADEPVDERWIGENPIAHYAWQKGQTVTMEEARKRWNV